MRILVLAPQPFYQPRGTPIAVRLLVETLAEAGHEVDLLAYHEGEAIPLEDAQLHRIASLPFMQNIGPGFSLKKVACDIAMAIKAVQMAWRNDYDLIHAVEEASFIARGLQWLTQTPYVFDMDSSMPQQIVHEYQITGPFQPLMEALEAWAIRGSTATVVVCKALEERVREASPNTSVLRLEDISMLDDPDGDTGAKESLRRKFSVEGAMVMYVGNLKSYQGIDLLIDAFRFVCNRGEPAHLVIIGGSEKRIEQYQAQAADRGIARRIHFAGPRPLEDLGGYLRQADVLVSPRTRGTNTPMKIYSYLDSGRPVVATRKRTHTQVLDDEIAMLAEPKPEAMADAIGRLLRDEALRDRLAANARERVAKRYSREAFRRKLTGFYQMLERRVLTHDRQEEAEPHVPTEL